MNKYIENNNYTNNNEYFGAEYKTNEEIYKAIAINNEENQSSTSNNSFFKGSLNPNEQTKDTPEFPGSEE